MHTTSLSAAAAAIGVQRPTAGTYLRAVGGLVGLVRPARPARRAADVPIADLPRARTQVRLRALPQRPRAIPTVSIAEGVLRPWRSAIGYTSFVVEHPRARLLLEPAVCDDLDRHVWREVPAALRAIFKPSRRPTSTVAALDRAGIPPESLDLAIATHLHWDHVSGLVDLPGLPLLTHAAEWRAAVEGLAIPAGIRDALAGREIRLVDLDGPAVLSFGRSHDLLGDGSVVLLDLAGHTAGSVGVLLATHAGPVLIAGDALWHGVQLGPIRQKASLPGVFVDSDRAGTLDTLARLHAIRDRVRVVASHDHDAACSLE